MSASGEAMNLNRLFVIWACIGLGALLSGAWQYQREGKTFVNGMHTRLGEMLLEEAVLLEKAGNAAQAEPLYRRALQAPFQNPRNLAFACKQLGALLVRQQRYQEALAPLDQGLASGAAPISIYKPYFDALVHLDRTTEGRAAAERWLREAEATGNLVEQARAHYQLGRMAQARGAREEAEAAFAAGNAAYAGHENALELARMAFAGGEFARALDHVQEALLSGPDAQVWREAIQLQQEILLRYAP